MFTHMDAHNGINNMHEYKKTFKIWFFQTPVYVVNLKSFGNFLKEQRITFEEPYVNK